MKRSLSNKMFSIQLEIETLFGEFVIIVIIWLLTNIIEIEEIELIVALVNILYVVDHKRGRTCAL